MEVDASSTRLDMLTESFAKVLAYGLRAPSLEAFQTYFPDMPRPVLEALLDLHRQVLLHVEINSKAEFADICEEHSIKEQIAEIEQLCAQSRPSSMAPGSSKDPAAQALAAEAHARLSAKQAEAAHLQMELARVLAERDSLRAAKKQREAHVEQLAAGYKAVAGSVKMVYDASRVPLRQQN